MSCLHDVQKYRRWNWDACNMCNENLDNLNKIVPYSYNSKKFSKPKSFSKYINNRHKRNEIKKSSNFDLIKHSQPKGIIFVWPQHKHFYYEREYVIVVRVLAQLLYWVDVAGLFPSGRGLPVKRPPWNINPTLRKPENRDYIIEPDWNSIYFEK